MEESVSDLIEFAEASAARVEHDPMDAYAADEAAQGLAYLCRAVRLLDAKINPRP